MVVGLWPSFVSRTLLIMQSQMKPPTPVLNIRLTWNTTLSISVYVHCFMRLGGAASEGQGWRFCTCCSSCGEGPGSMSAHISFSRSVPTNPGQALIVAACNRLFVGQPLIDCSFYVM